MINIQQDKISIETAKEYGIARFYTHEQCNHYHNLINLGKNDKVECAVCACFQEYFDTRSPLEKELRSDLSTAIKQKRVADILDYFDYDEYVYLFVENAAFRERAFMKWFESIFVDGDKNRLIRLGYNDDKYLAKFDKFQEHKDKYYLRLKPRLHYNISWSDIDETFKNNNYQYCVLNKDKEIVLYEEKPYMFGQDWQVDSGKTVVYMQRNSLRSDWQTIVVKRVLGT